LSIKFDPIRDMVHRDWSYASLLNEENGKMFMQKTLRHPSKFGC